MRAPTAREQVVLICHDESTFRSNEISNKRWMAPGHEPFYVKGRG
ncbi:unnamed protein product, partial [Didymodactylos carnosus]